MLLPRICLYFYLYLLAGANRSTDVIATHNYTYGGRCCASAEAIAVQWRALRDALPAEVARLPVWSTEGSWGDTATKEPNTDMQSAYVARAYLLGWSLGFKRMYWYAWGNSWGRLWSQSGVNGCSDQGSGTGMNQSGSKGLRQRLLMDGWKHHDQALYVLRHGVLMPSHQAGRNQDAGGVG